jgi:hypothetical protein
MPSKARIMSFKILCTEESMMAIQTRLTSIIGAYFPLESSEQFIIECLNAVSHKSDKTSPVVLTGDLSCRIEKMSNKTETVLGYLRLRRPHTSEQCPDDDIFLPQWQQCNISSFHQ